MSVLLTVLFVFSTTAQEKRTITIQEAVAIAMENNVEVIAARNNFNTVVANVLPLTVGANLPTVDMTARYSHADEASQFFTATGPKESAQNYSYSINANYVLFDGLKKFSQMSQARTNEQSARYDMDRTGARVKLQVYEAYVNVLKANELLKIAIENQKRSEEQLKRLEERNRLGAQIISDVYKQRVQVGSDKLALNRARNNLNTSKATLNSLIGLDVNTDLQLAPLDTELTYDSGSYDYAKAYDAGLQHRQDFLASVKRVESARQTLKQSRSSYYPTVNAFATYSWQDGFLPKNSSAYRQNDRALIGLNLTVPIFSGFSTSAGVEGANQSLQTAKSNVDNIRRQVALDVKIALLNMQTAYESVKLSEENVKAAKEDLRLATERYNLGAGTLLDQITSNASYTEAEANYVQSVYDFVLARQQYLLATGTSDQK